MHTAIHLDPIGFLPRVLNRELDRLSTIFEERTSFTN